MPPGGMPVGAERLSPPRRRSGGTRAAGRAGAGRALALVFLAAVVPARSAALRAQDVFGPPPLTPAECRDEVQLDDGRVLRCRIGAREAAYLDLEFPSGGFRLPTARVAEVRLFRDHDPEPRDDGERALAAQGLVRWGGKWVPPREVEAQRRARERAERLRREKATAHVSWEDRWKRNTTHFTVEANLAETDLDAYVRTLEDYYTFFTSSFKVAVRRRIPVLIFRTKAEFDEYRSRGRGHPGEHTVGYFVHTPGAEELVLFHDRRDRHNSMRTLLHEATHLLLHLARPEVKVPAWVNEGLAEYYSAIRYSRGRIVTGLVQEERLVWFLEMAERGRLLPMHDFMMAGHPDPNIRDIEFGLDHYAQAWAVLHFLMQGAEGKYRARLGAYLNGLWGLSLRDAAPGSSKAYLAPAWDRDIESVRRCLKVAELDSLRDEALLHARLLPVDTPAALLMRARHRIKAEGDPDLTQADLEAALAKGGDDPEVVLAAAFLFTHLPDGMPRASDLLRRVVALDPVDLDRRMDCADWLAPPERDVEFSLCLEIDPFHRGAPLARAWLAWRGTGPAGRAPAAPEEEAGALAAVAAADAAVAAAPSPGAWAAVASAALRAANAARAGEAAREVARSGTADPVLLETACIAIATTGDGKAFLAAIRALRDALLGGKGEAGPPSPEDVGAEVERVVTEAVATCWLLGLPREAARVVDTLHAEKDFPARSEADWVLYAGAALRAERPERAVKLATAGLEAHPGSGSLADLWAQATAEVEAK